MAKSLKKKIDTLEINLREKTEILEQTKEQLNQVSTSDPITGIANKQYFERVFYQEWSRAGRSHQSMAFMILELDGFDQYIDLFGEYDGNEALKQVAKVLSDTVRRTIDLVAHTTSAQFAIIAPNTESENAMILAENILRGIEYQGIVHPESKSGVFTACIGIGVYQGESDITSEELMLSVEHALKKAKSEGENRVVMSNNKVS